MQLLILIQRVHFHKSVWNSILGTSVLPPCWRNPAEVDMAPPPAFPTHSHWSEEMTCLFQIKVSQRIKFSTFKFFNFIILIYYSLLENGNQKKKFPALTLQVAQDSNNKEGVSEGFDQGCTPRSQRTAFGRGQVIKMEVWRPFRKGLGSKKTKTCQKSTLPPNYQK